MKVSSKINLGGLLHLKASFPENDLAAKYAGGEPPLRSELFSAEQMQQHGKTLAGLHQLSPGQVPDQLLSRLAENEDVLIGVRDLLAEAVKANRRIAPAGEWLLDNFYLIEEQIRTAKRHLPRGYSRELPRLLNGSTAGLPRVYDIALETISHGDGRVDPGSLSRFVAAYQTITDLTLGELWAIPIMLRFALVENLRRAAARIAAQRIDRNRADYWAGLMMEIAEKDPKSLILVIADMARSSPPMTTAFVAEFARRLQGQSPDLALPLTWIEQRLAESGMTIEQSVQSENQQQAVDQVSISNSIGSLRFLSMMDWREFVETMSVVERTLREDPSAAYSRMDFATRDRYRHEVEKMARRSRLSEHEVARHAIQLAQQGAKRNGFDDREAHVGFYLIDKGVPHLERTAEVRLSTSEALQRMSSRFPLLLYVGPIILMTGVFTAGLVAQAYAEDVEGWLLALVGLLSLLCTSQLTVALVNWCATLLVTPHALPRMDFSKGIPPESRALVVVPTMLSSVEHIEALTEALEVRFLANQDSQLHFGLLTDFRDAHEETRPEDEPLLRLAQKRIEELNGKFRETTRDAFFLFHRPRRWNPGERIWMGHERKRGKLADLNALLRGGSREGFSLVVGETSVLSNVRYVITLDTDTQLPRDAARQFVGAMAHPLNRARYNEHMQRVCEGYGILQPRVAVNLAGTNRSHYARLNGSEPGIDPYTRAVSDVYQDLFGEGSFIGKGIYEVDAFERALAGRFPENRILSHDLLEGCYARAGLLSDVHLYEENPSCYSEDVSRRHRWIRGDWQLAGWLLPRAPGPAAHRQKNPLSGLSRWKLLDNLRRSLVPSALTVLLLLGWTVLSPSWLWTLSVIGIILIPPLLAAILDLFQKPEDVLPEQHFTSVLRSVGRNAIQTVLTIVFLPYEAFFSMGAIVRTIWRMWVTHTRLLEWTPSSTQERERRTGLFAHWRTMWIGPLLALAALIYLMLSDPGTLAVAMPILGLWFASPAIAWWISQPITQREAYLTDDQTIFLRKLARKTWAFFEKFVGPDDHWLPPDNFQEHPVAAIAHRTSPTNMGLALLANLSAYDFGYISAGQLVERTTNAFHTMEGLERHRSHFYNWYDTQSLKPLLPTYVSTVDSGNLAGHLLTLRPGLLALPDQKILGSRFFDGLSDTCRVLKDVVGETAPAQFAQFQQHLESACESRPSTLTTARLCLDRLATTADEVFASLKAAPESQATWWARALTRQCRDALDELMFLAPWTLLSVSHKRFSECGDIDVLPTLRELAELDESCLPAIGRRLGSEAMHEERAWVDELRRLIVQASQRARDRIAAVERLARQAEHFATVEYDFLFDKSCHLLAIGYNVGERRRDSSYYDLLASEARLCSFVAIAQGQLPQENWFALGRLLTTAGGGPVLISWSGSMFEYLMPLMVMPTYEHTLLDQTYQAAVESQIQYGKQRGVPWGISESGYNTTDVHLNYQYRAFGVPGLGLKRGLTDDVVIAPYASALALMVAPEEACLNLQRLAAEGVEGAFGLYEAIDYTPSRLPRGQSSAVVRSYMAHHQGMCLLSLAYLLLDRPMQKRFESDPSFQATMLLLQERIPKATAFYSNNADLSDLRTTFGDAQVPVRRFNSPHTPIPEVQLLSNGRYHMMITNAGGGYSRWKDMAVTRWREDSTCDNWGTFCYIRDVESGAFWSTAYQPTLQPPQSYEVIFSEGRAEFRRRDHDIELYTEMVVSPEDDIELRRTRITNGSPTSRTIEITSYAEVVLASSAADALHPAFSNLFVQTEIIHERQAILCTRRPRSLEELSPWMCHLMTVHGVDIDTMSYETDRLQFIGRGRTAADPQAMSGSGGRQGGGRCGGAIG